MRLGGCLAKQYSDVESWLRDVKAIGYKAVTFPLPPGSDRSEIGEYVAAMKENDISNAEVGAWSNPLSNDAEERLAAMRKNVAALELAEETGARCCVNIAGSRGTVWDGPHPLNISEETFGMIVKNTREIIDAVKPVKTKYTLETMPWIFPDGPESYLRLMDAMERDAFGVHMDICNTVNSPERYFKITEFIDKNFDLLGGKALSIHLKDIRLSQKLTVHLDEALPGEGNMDFARIFKRAAGLAPDTTLIIEHLHSNEDYAKAYAHLRGVIKSAGLEEYLV